MSILALDNPNYWDREYKKAITKNFTFEVKNHWDEWLGSLFGDILGKAHR